MPETTRMTNKIPRLRSYEALSPGNNLLNSQAYGNLTQCETIDGEILCSRSFTAHY